MICPLFFYILGTLEKHGIKEAHHVVSNLSIVGNNITQQAIFEAFLLATSISKARVGVKEHRGSSFYTATCEYQQREDVYHFIHGLLAI